jgi:hypothetical protein
MKLLRMNILVSLKNYELETFFKKACYYRNVNYF